MEDLMNEDEKLEMENEELNKEVAIEDKENEERKLTKADILNLLRERKEIRKNNRQITASICLLYGQRKINGVKEKVIEKGNDIIEQAKMYGKNAEKMAKTIMKDYTDRREIKQNILLEYEKSLEAIANEYEGMEKYIIEGREKFEKAEEQSVQKELELREKRDEIRKSPKYAEHAMKEEQWLKEALEENNLDTLQEKKKKYEELKEQNPLTEYDEKIKLEKERRKKITDVIEMCDNALRQCQKEKDESIKEATKNKNNQIAENKSKVFQKVKRGLFYKINGTKKFANKVIGQLEEKVYDINNKLLPDIREKISDGIDKSIDEIKEKGTQLKDEIKERGTQLKDNMLEIAEDKLTKSIEKAEQVNVKRVSKYDILRGETEEQR